MLRPKLPAANDGPALWPLTLVGRYLGAVVGHPRQLWNTFHECPLVWQTQGGGEGYHVHPDAAQLHDLLAQQHIREGVGVGVGVEELRVLVLVVGSLWDLVLTWTKCGLVEAVWASMPPVSCQYVNHVNHCLRNR